MTSAYHIRLKNKTQILLLSLLVWLLVSDTGQDLKADQIDGLCLHRPQLNLIIKRNDIIWKWLSDKFAHTLGVGVIFKENYVIQDINAISWCYSSKEGHLVLAVRDINPRTNEPFDGEVILSWVVFELFNLSHENETAKLSLAAYENRVDADTFINSIGQSEFESSKQREAFYKDVYLPYALANDLPHHDTFWIEPSTSVTDYIMQRPGYMEAYRAEYYEIMKKSNPKFFIYEYDPREGRFKPIPLSPSPVPPIPHPQPTHL